jgi:selenocysteine lyase/cysteine desulfurase
VLFADTDFPTVPALWRAFARYGVEPLEVQVAGHSDPEAAILAALDERVKIVCLSHASFRTGALLDVARIAREAHRVGALVVVDAYQSVGTVPVDVEALGADFLLGGAHKWLCGAIESGFLYVRPSLTPSLTPAVTGWMAGADPLSFEVQTEQAPDARRFGAGTPMALPAMLSRVGLDLIHEVGPQAIREHSLSLTDRVLDWAEAEGVQTLTPRDPARRGGVVSLRFAGDREVAQRLVERGMICSWRGALRVAPHFYNTSDEIDRFLAALEAARREVER